MIHSRLFREKYQSVCDLYQQGNNPKDVGKIVGLSDGTIRTILHEYKIPLRKKVATEKPVSRFNYLLSENNRMREALELLQGYNHCITITEIIEHGLGGDK